MAEDLAVLRDAQDAAAALLRADPTLSLPEHRRLRRYAQRTGGGQTSG